MLSIKIKPNPEDASLVKRIFAINEEGAKETTYAIIEKPLSIYLNSSHVVTAMTIGDYPEYLAVGYLVNQNIIKNEKKITAIEYDKDINTVVVRSDEKTSFEIQNAKNIWLC